MGNKLICKFPDGSTKEVTYKEIKEHNELIIEDNVFFGLKHLGEYTEQEIDEYYSMARKEQKARMRKIRENPDISIVWNRTHEMYELEEEQEQNIQG